MGSKSDYKKSYIIKIAGTLFADKGFRVVTMKDVAEACQISRGGLYLYYSDTAALFLDVLAAESHRIETSLEEAMKDSSSAMERLSLFLKFQKKEIFASRDNLTVAVYEFTFAHENSPVVRERLEARGRYLQQIIEDGVREGSMACDNPTAYATHMIIQLEGLRIAARTALLTTSEADAAIAAMQTFITRQDADTAPASQSGTP